MDHDVVVRSSNSSKRPEIRIGEILIQDGDKYLVRWEDDGTEEDLRLGAADETLSRQSLRYQLLIDPESLEAAFRADPVTFVLRVVMEGSEPVNQKALRRTLSRLGISDFDIDTYVPTAWSVLPRHEGIVTSGSPATGRLKVAWIGVDPSLQPTAPVTMRQPSAGGNPEDAGRSMETQTAIPGEEPSRWSAVEEHAALPANASTAAETVTNPSKRSGESEECASTALAPDAPSVPLETDLLEQPPAGAAPQEFESCVEAADPPSPGRPGPCGELTLDALLAAAVGQIASTGGNTSEQRDAFAELLRRCAATEDEVTPAVVPSLVEVAGAVAAGGPRYAEVIEATLRQIAILLTRPGDDRPDDLDLLTLAAIAVRQPLTPRGGRVALLRAIAQVRPETLVADYWWADVTLKDLAGAARGGLGCVTSRQEVAEQVVRPLVLQELAKANTVARLGAVFGLPGEFVSVIPPESVGAALRRIAGENPAVAGWLRVLAGADTSERHQQELRNARDGLAQTQARVQQAERRAEELAERCRRLEEMVRSDHTQAVQLRSAQDRQIRIDGVRALAELAAEVEELAGETEESKALVERVRALIAVQDLEPVGETDEESPFDPSIHDPIGDSPKLGVPVTVIRPGYRWRPSGEDILLEKALVSIA